MTLINKILINISLKKKSIRLLFFINKNRFKKNVTKKTLKNVKFLKGKMWCEEVEGQKCKLALGGCGGCVAWRFINACTVV